MTKLEELKAEADTARDACNAAYAAAARAGGTVMVGAYADAYDAAAEVYQAELNKAQEE